MFIIAEIGINHNGDIEIAKKLMSMAKRCGCDAVKFQKRTIDKVYTKKFLDSPRESPWGKTQRDQKKALEFNIEEYKIIDNFSKELNIEWFASAWDEESQIFLRKFDLKYNKIASPMLVDLKFLNLVANEGKHTFISTGMSDIKMIDNAVEVFSKSKSSFELMHCVSTYPMSNEDANLKVIDFLRNRYKCDVGYSGHESGVAVSMGAAALGITSLERHITLDRTMYGSDQSASLEENGLKNVVGSCRIIEKALGKPIKIFSDKERIVAEKLREHLLIIEQK